MLIKYFPAQAAALNAKLAASLAPVPDGGAQDKGVACGIRAADRIIALRTNDGRNAAVTIPPATVAGDWEPTPPGFLSFTGAWSVESRRSPSTRLRHASIQDRRRNQLTDLSRGVQRGRESGGTNADTLRTPEQAQTALFFSDAGIQPDAGGAA